MELQGMTFFFFFLGWSGFVVPWLNLVPWVPGICNRTAT